MSVTVINLCLNVKPCTSLSTEIVWYLKHVTCNIQVIVNPTSTWCVIKGFSFYHVLCPECIVGVFMYHKTVCLGKCPTLALFITSEEKQITNCATEAGSTCFYFESGKKG